MNGVYACENAETLHTHLREWDQFEGFVMSDWGGAHSTASASRTGLDVEMPGGAWFTPAKLDAALASGSLTQAAVDTQVTRVLTSMYAVGIMDVPQPTGSSAANATSPAHAALAQHLAEQAATLLRNERATLPLHDAAATTVAVIGAAADCNASAPVSPSWGWAPSVGCINSGGGSGSVAAPYVTPILAAIRHRSAGVITYDSGAVPAKAAATAAAADVAVVVVGTTSGESVDRNGTSLPAQQLAYLKAVAASQPNTVVVVMAPGAVTMDWADTVASVVCFFMPGEAQGDAVARVLYGDVNPSGKTPVTMPRVENEMGLTPQQYPGLDQHGKPVPAACGPDYPIPHATYSERLLVGYRWYTAHPATTPAFSFGTGLSYTTFAYGRTAIATVASAADGASGGTTANRTLTFALTNTGRVAGAEVAQLYLAFPAAAGEPPLQLKGFQKVLLQPGQSQQVSFVLDPHALSVFDAGQRRWIEQHGEFTASIGGGLADLRQHLAFAN